MGSVEILALVIIWILGIGLSHALRAVTLKFKWFELKIAQIITRLILASIVFSLVFELAYLIFLFILSGSTKVFNASSILQDTLSWLLLFTMWSLIYFFYHFFKTYKQEEIKNLQLEAAHREYQLNRLRSQMNPHFIFNAMNGIRALIEEDPAKSKKAITQLSNVLRSSLLMDDKKLIPVQEEVSIVKDYLAIEKARYEERLRINWEIDELKQDRFIPPFILQTLVENAIKHGISKLAKGGELNIKLECKPNGCSILVSNDGKLQQEEQNKRNSTGYGLSSTHKRLELLYDDKASFELLERDNKVYAEVFIPEKTKTN